MTNHPITAHLTTAAIAVSVSALVERYRESEDLVCDDADAEAQNAPRLGGKPEACGSAATSPSTGSNTVAGHPAPQG